MHKLCNKNHIVKYNYLYCLLFLMLFNTPVQATGLLKHISALSRDYYYIYPASEQHAYISETNVGGEHENHYYLLGFKGQQFSIQISSSIEDVSHLIKDPGFILKSKIRDVSDSKSAKMTYIVEVIAQQVWIDVRFSAHPYAEYQLKVLKL